MELPVYIPLDEAVRRYRRPGERYGCKSSERDDTLGIALKNLDVGQHVLHYE